MSVEYDVSPTLRAQDHGNPPCVLIYDARGKGEGGGIANHHRGPSKSNHGLHGDIGRTI